MRIDINSLPDILRDDILALEQGIKDNVLHLDCLMNEVEGSIKCALIGHEITETQADELLYTYCYERREPKR